MLFLFDEADFLFVFARFGLGAFGGIAQGNAVEKLVVGAEAQSLQIGGTGFALHHLACGSGHAAGADTHRPGLEDEVLTQQTAVDG